MSDQMVAKTILEQLGGNRFITMTGSKNFISSATTLSFHLVPNPSKLRGMRIELTPKDLYTIYCMNLKGVVKVIYDNVYAEDLQSLFTKITGLDTHL